MLLIIVNGIVDTLIVLAVAGAVGWWIGSWKRNLK